MGAARILVGRRIGAAVQLRVRTYRRRAGDVDVDVVLVLRIDEDRVGVRAAARLDVRDVARVLDVGDVEDADALDARIAHSLLHALVTAIDAPRVAFSGHEEEVLVDRHVALRCRAIVRQPQTRRRWIGDVPDLVAVVVALDGVVALEGEIRVGAAEELAGRRGGRHEAHVPRGLTRVHKAGLETDTWIGVRRLRSRDGRKSEHQHERERPGAVATRARCD